MTRRDQPHQMHIDERETGSQPVASAPGNGSESSRLCLIGVKVDTALRREIDAYAEAHGVSRSRAAGHFLSIGREAIQESGRSLDQAEGVTFLRREAGRAVLSVSSGIYNFRSQIAP